MNNRDEFEEKIYQDLSGIKRFKKQKIISRFNAEDGVLSETEGGRFYVPGEGIVEGARETEILLDCGHSSIFGVGHVAECGHTVCRLCIQKYVLVCAHPGCFRNLCIVKGCRNSARVMRGVYSRMMIGVYFCKKHQLGMFVKVLGRVLFTGRRRTREWMDEIKQEYFPNALPEKRKRLTNGR
jgi:hypothetical protein